MALLGGFSATVLAWRLLSYFPESGKDVDPEGGTWELIDNIETVWQSPLGAATAIFFLAHGCDHSATDFWPQSEIRMGRHIGVRTGCPRCIGLPEEMAIVNSALKANMFVVAISSRSRCWSLGGGTTGDGDRVGRVLRHLIKRELPKGAKLPLYAFGASSGGSFVQVLHRCSLSRHAHVRVAHSLNLNPSLKPNPNHTASKP